MAAVSLILVYCKSHKTKTVDKAIEFAAMGAADTEYAATVGNVEFEKTVAAHEHAEGGKVTVIVLLVENK